MWRAFYGGLFLWLVQFAVAQGRPDPFLKSYDPPKYPSIALAARVEGQVAIKFLLNDQGEPISVSAIAGSPMLKGAAETFVETWRFDLRGLQPAVVSPYLTTIAYKLIRGVVDPRNPAALTVRQNSYRHFDVTAHYGDEQLSDCPTGADRRVPTEMTSDDFVEVSRSSCYGSCPNYSVRVGAEGRVIWNGFGSVETNGRREARIDAAAARSLIERFRTEEFWSLCGNYSRSITDSATTTIAVKMGSRSKGLSDYADSAPVAVQELELAVDDVSNSHRWRHGDPVSEPSTDCPPTVTYQSLE